MNTRAPRAILRHQRGFSLLEAIVALTIMATSMIALYAWLSSSAIALSRVHESSGTLEDQRTALAVVEAINPMTEPSGERDIEGLRVRWSSNPASETRAGITWANLPSAFDLALYDVDVEVLRSGSLVGSFRVRRAGWLLARPPAVEDF